jgi:hypothetical protein
MLKTFNHYRCILVEGDDIGESIHVFEYIIVHRLRLSSSLLILIISIHQQRDIQK